MAKQISISDEVYEMLLKIKAGRSFSEVIKSMGTANKKSDIMQFAGILKHKRKELEALEKRIAEERERNYGRKLEW